MGTSNLSTLTQTAVTDLTAVQTAVGLYISFSKDTTVTPQSLKAGVNTAKLNHAERLKRAVDTCLQLLTEDAYAASGPLDANVTTS
jgi:hypothetical protein